MPQNSSSTGTTSGIYSTPRFLQNQWNEYTGTVVGHVFENRERELLEATVPVLIWHPSSGSGSGSGASSAAGVVDYFGSGGGGASEGKGKSKGKDKDREGDKDKSGGGVGSFVGKTPLIREVPPLKRKLTKRDSAQFHTGKPSSFAEAETASYASVGGGSSSGLASSSPDRPASSRGGPSWLREKPSKVKLGSSSGSGSSYGSQGHWRRGTALLRENGVLTLFAEDSTLLHSISVLDLSSTDLRIADPSLFGRPYILGIYSQPSSFIPMSPASASSVFHVNSLRGLGRNSLPAGASASSHHHHHHHGASSTTPNQTKPAPIYICMSNPRTLMWWNSILRIYASPEIYGAPDSVWKGGTHRIARRVELVIYEARQVSSFDVHQSAFGPGSTAYISTSAGRVAMMAMMSGGAAGASGASGGGEAISPTASSDGGASFLARSVASSSTNPPPHNHPVSSAPSSVEADLPTAASSALGGGDGGDVEGKSLASSSASLSLHARKGSGSVAEASEGVGAGDGDGDGASDRHVAGVDMGVGIEETDREETGYSVATTVSAVEASSASASAAAAGRASREGSTRTEGSSSAASLSRARGARLEGVVSSSAAAAADAHSSSATSGECRVGSDFGPTGAGSGQPSMSMSMAAAAAMSPSYASSDCFCEVLVNGDVCARTKIRKGATGPAWVEKFELNDMPPLASLTVDVFQSARSSSKASLLGVISIPLDTLRRNEEVEGWFPISSSTSFTPTSAREADDRSALYRKAVVGELKASICVREDVVMPLRKYSKLLSALNGEKCVELLYQLARHLDEDIVISYLVDIYTANGTIVQRLNDMAQVESEIEFRPSDPELLFRGNTLLSRSLDRFQRLFCGDWLDLSIGEPIRRICVERVWLELDPLIMDPSATVRPKDGGPSQAERTVAELKKWTTIIWNSIYSRRHDCPGDLCRILGNIRATVRERFKESKPRGPGIQGVGAFVFLRLICPAMTSPHVYGLMANTPDPRCSRTLMLLAKTFLALANKLTNFQREKEPWMEPMDDFLKEQSEAFDDYITVVSTLPPDNRPQRLVQPEHEDEDAPLFKIAVMERLPHLSPLHRESVPAPPYLLDSGKALASFAAYVVRAAPGSAYRASRMTSAVLPTSSDHPPSERFESFVDLCTQIEEEAGRYVDRAGEDPSPLDLSQHFGAGRLHPRNFLAFVDRVDLSSQQPAASPPTSPTKNSAADKHRRSKRAYTVSSPPSPHSWQLSPPGNAGADAEPDQGVRLPSSRHDSAAGSRLDQRRPSVPAQSFTSDDHVPSDTPRKAASFTSRDSGRSHRLSFRSQSQKRRDGESDVNEAGSLSDRDAGRRSSGARAGAEDGLRTSLDFPSPGLSVVPPSPSSSFHAEVNGGSNGNGAALGAHEHGLAYDDDVRGPPRVDPRPRRSSSHQIYGKSAAASASGGLHAHHHPPSSSSSSMLMAHRASDEIARLTAHSPPFDLRSFTGGQTVSTVSIGTVSSESKQNKKGIVSRMFRKI